MRELELLSGIRRRNSDLLSAIARSLTARTPEDISALDLEEFSELATAESAIPISRRKLADIKRKKITSEQIDEIMDAADKNIEKHEGEKKKRARRLAAATASPPQESSTGSAISAAAQPMNFNDFVYVLSLYGKVIRNSEFTDASEKSEGLSLYLQGWIRTYLFLVNFLDGVLAELKGKGDESPLTDEEIATTGYLLRVLLLLGIQGDIVAESGSEKLFPIYENALDGEGISDAERLILSMLLLDLDHPDWKARWEKLIAANAKHRFVLDLLLDKMWRLIHTRSLSESGRDAMAKVALEIERGYGGSQPAKGEFYRLVGVKIDEVQREQE